MSPPSRTSAHAQGPRKCMCSPCLVWQPPSSTSQEQKLISAALSLILSIASHKTYYVVCIQLAMHGGLFPVASHRSTINTQMYIRIYSRCLPVSLASVSWVFFWHTHTLTLPPPDINQYDSKCKENIDPKHTGMMKAFICSAGSAMICEWVVCRKNGCELIDVQAV